MANAYAALVGLAALVFATVFLADMVRRRLGVRALLIIGGGVGVARLIEQINQDPGLDLVVTSIGVALCLMFIPILLETLRANQHERHFATSILLGVSIDTTIKGGVGHAGIVVGAGRAAAGDRGGRCGAATGPVGSLSGSVSVGRDSPLTLMALGPVLFLELQLFQNIGHVTTLTGFSQPLAFELIVLANALLAWSWRRRCMRGCRVGRGR